VGYDKDENALRQEFGRDMELDELETAGCNTDSGRHRQRKPQREYGANPRALVGEPLFQEPGDTESEVEEINCADRDNCFIIR